MVRKARLILSYLIVPSLYCFSLTIPDRDLVCQREVVEGTGTAAVGDGTRDPGEVVLATGDPAVSLFKTGSESVGS